MGKEISEKTFELNITNELLNKSKSMIWYSVRCHLCNIGQTLGYDVFFQFLNQANFFAEGLTQMQESNTSTGGYDVSINCIHPSGQESRLMFLQYKAGIRNDYCNSRESIFYRSTARSKCYSSEHVLFTFNDAANCTQHSTLRKLANNNVINPNSVMYVFPRITEKSEFVKNAGNLINNTSFVPVVEIDSQASQQTPSITINDGVSHKFRTSYDGIRSEINFFFFFFKYDNTLVSELLSELVCIQIERFARIIVEKQSKLMFIYLNSLSEGLNHFVKIDNENSQFSNWLLKDIGPYIQKIEEVFKSKGTIPSAPNRFTTIIPKEGLILHLNEEEVSRYSSINYQIF